MSDVYGMAALILAALLLYGFRARWLVPLRNFEAANQRRRESDLRDRMDPHAHFRHAMALADEQVEGVTEIVEPDARTGDSVTRYLFLAEIYSSRDEAEKERAAVVASIAREFYRELPAALAARGGKERLN